MVGALQHIDEFGTEWMVLRVFPFTVELAPWTRLILRSRLSLHPR